MEFTKCMAVSLKIMPYIIEIRHFPTALLPAAQLTPGIPSGSPADRPSATENKDWNLPQNNIW